MKMKKLKENFKYLVRNRNEDRENCEEDIYKFDKYECDKTT